MSLLKDVVDTATSMVKGHQVTASNLFSKPVTLHYPEQRRDLATGYRGMPALKVNPQGELNCTGCGLCARSCPVDVIDVEMREDEEGNKKQEPAFFNLDMSRCLLCNLCVEACPFDALEMTDNFEFADYRVEDLVFDMHELAEIWKAHNAVRVAAGEKIS